jgi:hypothetical protein
VCKPRLEHFVKGQKEECKRSGTYPGAYGTEANAKNDIRTQFDVIFQFMVHFCPDSLFRLKRL